MSSATNQITRAMLRALAVAAVWRAVLTVVGAGADVRGFSEKGGGGGVARQDTKDGTNVAMKPRLPDSPIPCAARPIAAQVPNQGVDTRKIWASTVTMKSAKLTAAVASALRKLLASPPQDPAAQAGEAINAPAAMMLASAAAISVATVAITPGWRT